MIERAFLAILLLSASLSAQLALGNPDDQLQPFQGSYRFPDGVIVTGGRMDEGGRVMLSYLDTARSTRAGVFDTSGEIYEGLYGTRAAIAFENDGRVMIWRSPGEEPLRAERIMQPDRRAAAFSNGKVELAGTLYFPPKRTGEIPAIVLAHGSGPANRYLGPWVTFFVDQGLAVLAFDKRGTGESEGDWQLSTYLDLAADVAAAGEWLSGQPGIDASKIGLKTSSQSGWYGPRVLEQSPVFSFLIQRAAPAVNIGVGTAHEIRREMKADGVPLQYIDAAVDFWLQLHEMAGSGASLELANDFLRAHRAEDWFEPAIGDWDVITKLWWHQHVVNMQLEPAAATARLAKPVLWFLAENDDNVPYRASLSSLEVTTQMNPDLTVVTIHNAGHSFLVSNEDEALRYTDEYWPRMAAWLNQLLNDPRSHAKEWQ